MALKEVKYAVELWEYESGWGSRHDDTVLFDTEEEARKYVEEFNSKNTEKIVPDWYMSATYSGVKVLG